jgi:DUF4097 and DUF4098 domain-containing protein YvlB
VATSPGFTPPPRPQRSIAGPVVLILMGLLFLGATMGAFNMHALGIYFARFWPALLILWGIIKLVEHERAKRAGLPGRGIGVGGVFLVIFIIVAGLIATQTLRLWPTIRDNIQIDDDQGLDEIFGGSSFDYSGDLSNDWPAGTNTLRINDDHGTVTVNVSDDNKLKVSWRKKIHAENQRDADAYNTKTDVTITPADKVLVLNANVQGSGNHSVDIDMDVYVPHNANLVITSRRGDVSITGLTGNVEVNHQRGEVDISDQTGNASLNLERSGARLSRIKGDVGIQGRANEIAVEDIDGAVHLNGDFMESVRLVRVTKTVGFRSSRTDMEFSRLDGRLDLDSGDLRADSLSGPMHLITRSKDISLEGLSGDLRLENSNGTVEVGVRKPGSIQIENRKGDVQVTIPPNAALNVSAHCRGGSIQSDFNELKIDNGERESNASGSIGSNGSRLVINGEHGSIEIRRGELEAATPAPPTPPVKPGKAGKALPAPKTPPEESEN